MRTLTAAQTPITASLNVLRHAELPYHSDAQKPSQMQAGAVSSSRYPLLTNWRKMKVKKQRDGAIQTIVKSLFLGSAGTLRRSARTEARDAAPKPRRKMKTIVQARTIEVAGEELKTVFFEGTSHQSETKAPK